MFHFMQCINRKIIKLGLSAEYSEVSSTREQVKQLMGLCLMPISEVERQFKRIQSISSSSLDDLFTYFDRQWINGNIALSMWNFHELEHRTNNVSEGNKKNTDLEIETLMFVFSFIKAYNRRFGTRIMKKHPNIWTFIQMIQGENARCEHLIIQLGTGASSSKQLKQTTMFQRRFVTLRARFANYEINSKQLLDGLGLLLGRFKK